MKKSFLIILLLSLFFIPKDTFALQENYTDFMIGGNRLDHVGGLTIQTQGTRNITFDGNVIRDSNEVNSSSHLYVYYKLAFCSTSGFSGVNPGTNSSQVYRNNTSYSCRVSGVGDGKVVFVYFRAFMPSNYYNLTGDISFATLDAPFSIQLMYYQFSNTAFDYDESDSINILKEIEENTRDFQNSIEENTEATKEQTEATKEQTETIKDKDVSESQSQAGDFFNDFDDNDFGLSDIITMPLTFIQGLANNSCSNLNLPLPFVDKNATLPCMTSIYQQHFGAFLSIYQIITTGFISYWVCINIFRLVKNFKDPNNDEVEVLDL